ncbi:hypothetical protein EDD85DRAFT_864940 [Armillaria nabsnona]|nr:hypothetical protein EDD85DRAFT_864940 [Armillaria nabsnona]
MLLQGMEQCSLAMLVVPVEGSSCQRNQCHHDEINEPITERTGPGLDGPYIYFRPDGITRGAATTLVFKTNL